MAFLCPQCDSQAGGLKVTQRIELPADSRSDEISLQILKCTQCGFEAVGVYQESRRGSLDSESWSHWGYRLSAQALRGIKQLLRDCPQRTHPHCTCQTHQTLACKDASGRWNLLDEHRQASFPIKRT